MYPYFVPGPPLSFLIVTVGFGIIGFSLAVILVVTAFDGISKHGFLSRDWLLPPFLCVMFLSVLILWPRVKSYLDDWQFERNLGDYTRIVNDVKSGGIRTTHYTQIVDSQVQKFPGRVGRIWAAHCNHRTVVVEFFIPSGGGAVGPHGGYLFNDCDNPAVRAIRGDTYDKMYSLYHIRGAWYEFGI